MHLAKYSAQNNSRTAIGYFKCKFYIITMSNFLLDAESFHFYNEPTDISA